MCVCTNTYVCVTHKTVSLSLVAMEDSSPPPSQWSPSARYPGEEEGEEEPIPRPPTPFVILDAHFPPPPLSSSSEEEEVWVVTVSTPSSVQVQKDADKEHEQ